MWEVFSVGFVPFVSLFIAAAIAFIAIGSKKAGAAESGRGMRHLRVWLYLSAAVTFLLLTPQMGWWTAPIAILLATCLALVCVWTAFPSVFLRNDGSKRDRLDTLAWGDDKIKMKRWFAKGEPMGLILWVRRALLVGLGAYLVFAAILINLFGGVEDEAAQKGGSAAVPVAEQSTQSTPKATPTDSHTSSASPAPSPTVVSFSPAPKPSRTATTTTDNECDAPKLTSIKEKDFQVNDTSIVEVCEDGVWKSWDKQYPEAGTEVSTRMDAYAKDDGRYYAAVNWDGNELLIRFAVSEGYRN